MSEDKYSPIPSVENTNKMKFLVFHTGLTTIFHLKFQVAVTKHN